MSIYGHYSEQYYGNKIIYPEESFLISGISFYKENCINLSNKTELTMKSEPDNKYDPSAIVIMNNDKIIGYVPNTNTQIKTLCEKNIDEKLKIIHIKQVNDNYGIRVIPKCYYEDVDYELNYKL